MLFTSRRLFQRPNEDKPWVLASKCWTLEFIAVDADANWLSPFGASTRAFLGPESGYWKRPTQVMKQLYSPDTSPMKTRLLAQEDPGYWPRKSFKSPSTRLHYGFHMERDTRVPGKHFYIN